MSNLRTINLLKAFAVLAGDSFVKINIPPEQQEGYKKEPLAETEEEAEQRRGILRSGSPPAERKTVQFDKETIVFIVSKHELCEESPGTSDMASDGRKKRTIHPSMEEYDDRCFDDLREHLKDDAELEREEEPQEEWHPPEVESGNSTTIQQRALLSLSVSISLSLSVSISLSLSLSISLCLCLSVSLCLSLYLSLSLSLSLSLYLSVSLALSICLTLSLYLSLSISLCLSLYLSHSVSLSLCLSPSLSL